MVQKINIYAICTTEDTEGMLQLMRHLKLLLEDADTTIWHDNPIKSGEQWKFQIDSRLEQTDVFLLLVSDAFMHSEFINQIEFKWVIDAYKAGNASVIPILIDDCQWNIDFKSDDYNFNLNELQVLPEGKKPVANWESLDKAYIHTATSIRQLIVPSSEHIIHKEPKRDEEVIAEKEIKEKAIEEKQIAMSFSEEAALKNIATDKKRIADEVEVKRIAEEKRNLDEEETKKVAEEQKREAAETEAKREAEEEERRIEEKEAKRVLAVVEAKQIKQETKQKQEARANNKAEETQQGEQTGRNKKILIGAIIALLAIIGIWAFSGTDENLEKSIPVINNTPEAVTPKATPSQEVKIDSEQKETSVSKLSVGDQFEGGMIFSLDSSNKNGKIVHMDDAGPMPWQSANKIHEQLGEGWRLPTLKELQLMRKTVGQGTNNSAEFADGLYWSSTAFDEHQARLLRLRDGNTSYHYNRNVASRKFRVRAVKDFSR